MTIHCKNCDQPLPVEAPRRGRPREHCNPACAQAWHRKHGNRGWAEVEEYVAEVKAGVPCMDCGGHFPPVCMDFDHRPGELKIFNIAQRRGFSLDAVIAEAAKCDLVCACCHRVRTQNRHAV